MFRVGIGELSLVVVLLLVLAPDVVPGLVRTLGRVLGLLAKLSQEVQEEIGISADGGAAGRGRSPAAQRRRPDGPAGQRGRASSPEKLRTLDAFAQDYRAEHAAETIRLAVDEDRAVAEQAASVLALDPLFAFERRRLRQDTGQPQGPRTHLERYFEVQRIADLSAVLAAVEDERLDQNLERLCRLPGIENLEPSLVFAGSKGSLRDRFQQLCGRFEGERYPAQVSFAPSYRCNANCSYCFTRALERRFPGEMTAAEFARVLDGIRLGPPLRRVGLLGGEPTLSAHIDEYVEELERRNLSFYFATNGLAPEPEFRRIVRSNRLEMVTFHVESDDFYEDGQIDLLRANIAAINQDRVTLVLRYNLSSRDFDDWSFLDKYLQPLQQPGVSFAVVFPSRRDSNDCVPLDDLEGLRPRILSFVRYLVQATEGRPRTIALAKPFPLCMFDQGELQFLMRTTRIKNVCEIDRNDGTNNICVNADRSFFPCMALNSEEFRFPDIVDRDSPLERCRETVRRLVKTPLLDRCRGCLLHARGVCQAACYAYV